LFIEGSIDLPNRGRIFPHSILMITNATKTNSINYIIINNIQHYIILMNIDNRQLLLDTV